MTARIKRLKLLNFRSYESFSLDAIGNLTIFVGPNAAGKTNVIEAIHLITAISPLRPGKVSQQVHKGMPFAKVDAELEDGARHLDVGLQIQDNKRRYTLNGKPKQIRALQGIAPSVSFTPDDLELVKGSNSNRRDALDLLGVQASANYRQIASDFAKLHKHKQALLKDDSNIEAGMLEALNEVFAKVSSQLTAYRRSLFLRLMPSAQEHYASISGGEELVGTYVPSWLSGEDEASRSRLMDLGIEPLPASEFQTELACILAASSDQELARERCLAGAHLDEIRLSVDGMPARDFASQGQARSVVLAWKLAEADLIEEMLKVHPILLLDDVMSELDGARRAALVQRLSSGMQSFVTTANLQYFDKRMLEDANVVNLG